MRSKRDDPTDREYRAVIDVMIFAGKSPASIPDDLQAFVSGYRIEQPKLKLVLCSGRLFQDIKDFREAIPPASCSVPLDGADWEALDWQVRQLLLFMREREEADLQDVCLAVWAKDCVEVTDAARQTTISKANNFLRKRESPRSLSKVRNVSRLRWK